MSKLRIDTKHPGDETWQPVVDEWFIREAKHFTNSLTIMITNLFAIREDIDELVVNLNNETGIRYTRLHES